MCSKASNINVDAKIFWDNCHDKEMRQSICGFCENGKYYTTYEKTLEFLKIKEFIKSNVHVLEFGVGLGIVTKAFYDNGLIVSGLDISEIALEKVKKYCENIYTTNDLDKLPSDYFDIIICNSVVQHVPTDLLIEELKYCLRSLKINGIFAVQFVSNSKIEDMGLNPNIKNIRGGTCCRSPKYLEGIINKLGGKCELVYSDTRTSGSVEGCHVFHVRRIISE